MPALNKKFLAVLVPAVCLILAVAAFWAMRREPAAPPPALANFDYASPASWAQRPDMPPPAVWEADWQTDVLVLAQGQALEALDPAKLEKQTGVARQHLGKLSRAFESIGPVYAPYLRAGRFDSDASAAIEHYLSTDNRGRAFFVATDSPLPTGLAPLLLADPLLRDRFGGVLMYADAPAEGMVLADYAKGLCSRRFEDGEGCVAAVKIKRAGTRYEVSGADPLVDGLVGWLNVKSSKLAEPLGELEDIEIIAIQKPPEPH